MKTIAKIIGFFIWLVLMFITTIPATPSAMISINSGINMYNQKGFWYFLAKPFLFFHRKGLKLIFNSEPNTEIFRCL